MRPEDEVPRDECTFANGSVQSLGPNGQYTFTKYDLYREGFEAAIRKRPKTLELTILTDEYPTSALRHLELVPDLKTLSFPRHVTDAGLANLAPLKNLRQLYVSSPHVTDAGVEHIARIKSLREVTLHGTKVTGAAARRLAELLPHAVVYWGRGHDGYPDLRFPPGRQAHGSEPRTTPTEPPGEDRGLRREDEVDRSPSEDFDGFRTPTVSAQYLGMDVLDEEFEAWIRERPDLRALSLWAEDFPMVALRHLQLIPEVKALHLQDGIEDDGFTYLEPLKNLRALHIESSHVTDAALDRIAKISSLREVRFSDTKVTAAGARRLVELLPHAVVFLDGERFPPRPHVVAD